MNIPKSLAGRDEMNGLFERFHFTTLHLPTSCGIVPLQRCQENPGYREFDSKHYTTLRRQL